jgi:exodeoxyribonuclease X
MHQDVIVVTDTETTGYDPETCSLLEVGWVAIDSNDGKYVTHDHSLIRYDGVIPSDAKAVHHITEAMVSVRGLPTRDQYIGQMLQAEVPGEMYYAAHNAAFDRGFLPELDPKVRYEAALASTPGELIPDLISNYDGWLAESAVPWICTWRCAMHMFPDAPSHKNQALRYELGLEPMEEAITEDPQPHRALFDAAVTASLVKHMLTIHTVKDLLDMSTKPVVLTKIGFGKHKGQPFAEVPIDYMAWYLRQSETDPDTVHSMKISMRDRGVFSYKDYE